MRWQRKSLGGVVGATAGISGVYLTNVLLQSRTEVVFVLFTLAVAATAWLVVRILKDPYSTEKTFDDQFYQDRDDIHRIGTKRPVSETDD